MCCCLLCPAVASPLPLKSAFPPEAREELQVAISAALRDQGSAVIGRQSVTPAEQTLVSAMTPEALDKWVAQTVRNFLEMDLFAAVSHFLSLAKVG